MPSTRRRRTAVPGGRSALRRYLAEDRHRRDLTSRAVLPSTARLRARLEAQGEGIVSGVAAATALLEEAGLRARPLLADGSPVAPGTAVLLVEGPARRVLAAERSALNLLMHLSGVATATARLRARAQAAKAGFRIAATRKTLPGLRDLEKAAVVHGGGEPHRRDLSDALLVKTTHTRLVPLEACVARAIRAARGERRVLVEVLDGSQARRAVQAGATHLLLDNLTPAQVRRIARALEAQGLRQGRTLEVSGGIDVANVEAYARSGADVASVGALTHSAPALPFHLVLDGGLRPPSGRGPRPRRR